MIKKNRIYAAVNSKNRMKKIIIDIFNNLTIHRCIHTTIRKKEI